MCEGNAGMMIRSDRPIIRRRFAGLRATTGSAILVLVPAIVAAGAGAIAPPPLPPRSSAAAAAPEKMAYFRQQSLTGRDYTVKNLETSGVAAKLTTLVYGFENIDPSDLTCFQAVHPAATSPADANAGDGAGDAFSDYQKPYTAATSVSGKGDSGSQALKGNFNQLRQLKAKYPKLKILLAIGGPTYSKYYSKAAATAASRTKFINSCINMYIQGNLPKGINGNASGGARSAAGIFDGIDVDWRTPASPGHVGNFYGGQDTADFTALLAEFRSQLDAQAAKDKRPYLLTASLPAIGEEMSNIDATSIGHSLDWADVRAYDLHDAHEASTNFQAPLLASADDPAAAYGYTVQETVSAWVAAGLPAAQLVLDIPFEWRGWSGVTAGSTHGLYQKATGASPAFAASATPGLAGYGELVSAGKVATTFWDDVTQSPWSYDGSAFYTGDTPKSVYAKTLYVRAHKLRGAIGTALDQDDASGSLAKALAGGLTGIPIATKVTTLATAPGTRFSVKYGCAKGITAGVGVLDGAGVATGTNVSLGKATSSDQVTYTRTVDIGAAGVYFIASTCNGVRSGSVKVVVPVSYVALGDGYSSGEGSGAYLAGTDQKGNLCHRSKAAFPYTVQARKHAGRPLMATGACSGATVADLTAKNHSGNTPEPAQRSWLRPSVDLVSVSVGQNDIGFAALMKYCAARAKKAASCQSHSKKTVDAAITALGSTDPATKGNLFSAYVALKTAAPAATLVVVGYPRPFPLDLPASCPTGLSGKVFTRGDMAWINTEIGRLNTAVAGAAVRAGLRVTYVDTTDAFAGHELCTASPYLNPARTGTASVLQGNFQPTAAGQRALAALVVAKVT